MFTLSSESKAEKPQRVERAGRCPGLLSGLVASLFLAAPAFAFVYGEEFDFFPWPGAWQRIVSGTPERRVENGWLIETLEPHEQDFYRYDLGGISSLVGRFFLEWRAVTDNPEWLIYESQVPAVVVAGGMGGSIYHVVMTESAAVLFRDAFIPWVVVPVSTGVHTYRVEVYNDAYLWYVDGLVVDSGVPEGPYPDPNAQIVWGAEVTYDGAPAATTAWDYVRFGEIPQDSSGDFDSDADVDRRDYRFVHECLTKDGELLGGPVAGGPGAGPGCDFADWDGNGSVDLFDIAEFQVHFTGSQ